MNTTTNDSLFDLTDVLSVAVTPRARRNPPPVPVRAIMQSRSVVTGASATFAFILGGK